MLNLCGCARHRDYMVRDISDDEDACGQQIARQVIRQHIAPRWFVTLDLLEFGGQHSNPIYTGAIYFL